MKDKINNITEEFEKIKNTKSITAEDFRLKFLVKKGIIPSLFQEMKALAPEDKKRWGKILNDLKKSANEIYKILKEKEDSLKEEKRLIDYTLPGEPLNAGNLHPLTKVRNEIVDIFIRLGYNISEGPEIEDDWHNFSALNFPEDHPARDMQDTFFIHRNPDYLLRTHTSSVQVRVMEETSPPIRTISPGRVFRNEAISARAHCIFHQVEGLYIDKDVSFADLKQTLIHFAKEMFGKDTEIRLRPSYFPFTEPSAEMDVTCLICKGKGCHVCKQTGFVEIMGCGMVDPNVLKNCGIDPSTYSGFAFGMGIERIAMLKYKINDLRLFFENDIRFLGQF
jgi:phenylalanyl-tRNA synthetase alpha chain